MGAGAAGGESWEADVLMLDSLLMAVMIGTLLWGAVIVDE